jgi:hypothetical protein
VSADVLDDIPFKVWDVIGMDEVCRLDLEIFVMVAALLRLPRVLINYLFHGVL